MFEVEEDEETHLPLIFILARVAGLNKHLSAENVLAQSTKNLRSQGFLFFTLLSFSPTLFLLPSRSLSLSFSLSLFFPYLPVASLSFYFFSFSFLFFSFLFLFFRVFFKIFFLSQKGNRYLSDSFTSSRATTICLPLSFMRKFFILVQLYLYHFFSYFFFLKSFTLLRILSLVHTLHFYQKYYSSLNKILSILSIYINFVQLRSNVLI